MGGLRLDIGGQRSEVRCKPGDGAKFKPNEQPVTSNLFKRINPRVRIFLMYRIIRDEIGCQRR